MTLAQPAARAARMVIIPMGPAPSTTARNPWPGGLPGLVQHHGIIIEQ